MRFERWRGMPLALTMAAVGWALLGAETARADGYHIHKTIPREVVAYDYSTGGVMMAPPVPYGHYAKDGLLDCAACRMHNLLGCLGCGHDGCGHGLGHGNGCGACGGRGCGLCKGHGGGDPGCGVAGCGGGHGHHHKAGRFAPCDAGVGPAVAVDPGAVAATSQSVPAATAVVLPSGQDPCGVNGCGVKGRHSHHGRRCGLCGGKGCGGCGGSGKVGCGDPGCGLCGGKGHGGNGCKFCGGKGCGHCLHGLGGLHGKLAGLLHHQKVEYFVGAGGPVPLTPGYVPYVVVTRSPRDFFSFPPMNPYDP